MKKSFDKIKELTQELKNSSAAKEGGAYIILASTPDGPSLTTFGGKRIELLSLLGASLIESEEFRKMTQIAMATGRLLGLIEKSEDKD